MTEGNFFSETFFVLVSFAIPTWWIFRQGDKLVGKINKILGVYTPKELDTEDVDEQIRRLIDSHVASTYGIWILTIFGTIISAKIF